ncbi:MAG: phage tail sheath family protein [Acidobacteria bacterium]|nr:phage tail sheath family protein [Acidobacteriota bacterium]
MYAYSTPGVYFEWIDVQPPVLGPLRTDIAGFVGIAERGLLNTPVRIDSWAQFTGSFGRHIPQGYLAYAVEGFFENGGRTCWVVRVTDPQKAKPASAEWRATSSSGRSLGTVLHLSAHSPGAWGNDILCTIVRTAANRFTLKVQLPDGAQEVFRNLEFEEADSRSTHKTIETINDLQGGSRLVTVTALPEFAIEKVMGEQHEDRFFLEGGQDGLATLTPEHFIGEMSSPDQPLGLAALAKIDEVSIVAIPDIMPKRVIQPRTKSLPPRCDLLDAESPPPGRRPEQLEFPPAFDEAQILDLQLALIRHCESLKDRVAVLDSLNQVRPDRVINWRALFNTKYGALYHPWLMAPDALNLEGLLRPVPPSGHIAGVYARSDLRVGVHKPPANEEIEAANNVGRQIDDIIHGLLNDESVNVIRPYNGRGIRVAGARTLSRDPEWRYVNVRRLMTMIEEAIDEGTQWIVFEPNNQALWRDIDRVVRNFLEGLWRRGMLDGATSDDAFFVRCDETTNSPEDTEAGRVICMIGVQPPWPAEFVVVRIGRTQGATEIVELGGG